MLIDEDEDGTMAHWRWPLSSLVVLPLITPPPRVSSTHPLATVKGVSLLSHSSAPHANMVEAACESFSLRRGLLSSATHWLEFLPAQSVATCCMVCTSFRQVLHYTYSSSTCGSTCVSLSTPDSLGCPTSLPLMYPPLVLGSYVSVF